MATEPLATSSTPPLRPWGDFLSLSTISIPLSLSEIPFRVSTNLRYFLLNYINVSLIILFLSLLFHPFAVIVFLVTAAAWFYFYVQRVEPLIVLGRTIDDLVVLVSLGIVTLLALILTNVWRNVFASLAISAVVILMHAAIRAPEEDLESPYGSLLSGTDSPRGGYAQV